MKITLLLIPILFFMTSCTINWNDEKDKKIAELEKQIQDDTFKKKQECGKYSNNIESKIEEKQKELTTDGDFYNENIEEIFYSKTAKSCIALSRSLWVIKNKNDGTVLDRTEYERIYDLLSHEETNYDLQDGDTMQLYNQKVKKLKGE